VEGYYEIHRFVPLVFVVVVAVCVTDVVIIAITVVVVVIVVVVIRVGNEKLGRLSPRHGRIRRILN